MSTEVGRRMNARVARDKRIAVIMIMATHACQQEEHEKRDEFPRTPVNSY